MYRFSICFLSGLSDAVYTLQQSLRTWFDNHYARISTLGQTPFAIQLGKFLTQLQTHMPALKPVGCFYNMMVKSVSALVSQSVSGVVKQLRSLFIQNFSRWLFSYVSKLLVLTYLK